MMEEVFKSSVTRPIATDDFGVQFDLKLSAVSASTDCMCVLLYIHIYVRLGYVVYINRKIRCSC